MSPPACNGAAPPLAPGAAIAPGYEVIEHLRRGNDLDVYDVWSADRGCRCVVKAARPDRIEPRRRDAIASEGELLERLAHPHIVRAYETHPEPVPLIVLETLPGATLSVVIEEGSAPDPAELGHLGLQLGSALAYLHAHDVLHLDLKPSNVIADAGRAKLIDLSVARPPGPAPPGVGTWLYLSPEQARGGELGAAADVWGLGATLFAYAAGEGPFDDEPDDLSGSDSRPERYPQLERPPRRVDWLRPVVPEMAELIGACLEHDAAARPTLGELLAGFETLAQLPLAERRWSAAAAQAFSR